MAPSDQGESKRGEMMPHSGGAVRQPWPINSSAAAQKDATDTPLQRGECSGCGDPLSLRPCQPEQGAAALPHLGGARERQPLHHHQPGRGRGGHGRTGVLTPIPFDTAIAVPYSAATQVTDCKMRLSPTRLPGQVVRTGPIMVTVSVPWGDAASPLFFDEVNDEQ